MPRAPQGGERRGGARVGGVTPLPWPSLEVTHIQSKRQACMQMLTHRHRRNHVNGHTETTDARAHTRALALHTLHQAGTQLPVPLLRFHRSRDRAEPGPGVGDRPRPRPPRSPTSPSLLPSSACRRGAVQQTSEGSWEPLIQLEGESGPLQATPDPPGRGISPR